MTFVSFSNNTTGVTSGAGTASPSETLEFTPDFKWASNCSIFSFLCKIPSHICVQTLFYGHEMGQSRSEQM